MINTKKIITKIKTKKFLKKFPIFLLLQHNNCNVQDWLNLRQKLQERSNSNILNSDSILLNSISKDSQGTSEFEILNVKNSLLIKILGNSHLLKKSNPNILNFLCQGPNFIIGCKDQKYLTKIWNLIKSNPKFVFISCVYKNKLLNHLDLEIFLKIDNSTYSCFFKNLDRKTEIYNLLQQNLNLYPLLTIQHNLLNILSLYSFFYKKENLDF